MSNLLLTILGGIVCGITMVLGGIFLLSKGAIKLEAASKDPALTVELFNKEFSLMTRVPALGLFVIGLLFVGGSMWVAVATDVPRIPVVGEITNVDEPIRVTVYKEWPIAASQHEVNDVLRPSFDVLWVRITAPGYRDVTKPFEREKMGDQIKLGKIVMQRAPVPRVETKEQNIQSLSFTAPEFDPNAGGGFFSH